MSAFPDWEKYAVIQRRPGTGCIPTGYEILLRAACVSGIDFDSFQDEFDLDKNLKPKQPHQNHFRSVANAIQKKYPHVNILTRSFSNGSEKLQFIEGLIVNQRPVLISLALVQFNFIHYHVMPIVDATTKEVILLWATHLDGRLDTQKLLKEDLVKFHDNYPGGDDVAYLDI